MSSPFEVLRLDQDADDEEIERAYRHRVKEAHPDQGGSVAEFRAVRTAYEKLKAGYEPGDEPVEQAAAGTDDPVQAHAATSEVTYLNYDVLADHGWMVEDDDLFANAAEEPLSTEDYGTFEVKPGESLLEAAENRGFAWPFACRGGACANCAIMLVEGELSMPANHVLPTEMMEQDIRLSCNGMPITEELKVLFNVKHMPKLEELLLPPRPFKQAHLD
ncbi:MAG: ferredoxin [Haloarculaceae archaeon]|jgi:ferredoxin